MPQLTEQQVVDKVSCPACNQGVGKWCKTKSGNRYVRLHAARMLKAGAGWNTTGKRDTPRKY